jgi:Holliday junction resolvase RusA-like endonuclease
MTLPDFADPPFACPPDDPMIGGIVLDLPMPPSVNRIWRANRAGPKQVSISPEYAAWKRHADQMVLQMAQFRGLKTIVGKFEAKIVLKRCRGDLDNRAKGVLDFLQSRAVVVDDKYCERLTLEWGDAPHGCRVTVRACV